MAALKAACNPGNAVELSEEAQPDDNKTPIAAAALKSSAI